MRLSGYTVVISSDDRCSLEVNICAFLVIQACNFKDIELIPLIISRMLKVKVVRFLGIYIFLVFDNLFYP